jgi:hypothetical protein
MTLRIILMAAADPTCGLTTGSVSVRAAVVQFLRRAVQTAAKVCGAGLQRRYDGDIDVCTIA